MLFGRCRSGLLMHDPGTPWTITSVFCGQFCDREILLKPPSELPEQPTNRRGPTELYGGTSNQSQSGKSSSRIGDLIELLCILP
jgi:hypothetical protein